MPRLIDLHCDWLLQYATETTVFDPPLYAGVERRLGQAEGYLQGTSAAVVSCSRRPEDWARQADPWRALGDLVARVEAEFPGRLLIGPDDHARWRDDPDGLCWAVIGVERFDVLTREPSDLDRLPGLFARGVRVFQPVGTAALPALADLAPTGSGPRPVLDLARMDPAAVSDALAWLESDPSRAGRLIPVASQGALTPESLTRLRALGGVVGFRVGPPSYPSADALKAAIESAAAVPFLGRPGYEGLALATGFLGVDETLPGLGNVEEVMAWVRANFDPSAAESLIAGTGRDLLARLTGLQTAPPTPNP